MNIASYPLCVLECEDANLQSMAKTAFDQGDAKDKAEAMRACLEHARGRDESRKREEKQRELDAWVDYLRVRYAEQAQLEARDDGGDLPPHGGRVLLGEEHNLDKQLEVGVLPSPQRHALADVREP